MNIFKYLFTLYVKSNTWLSIFSRNLNSSNKQIFKSRRLTDQKGQQILQIVEVLKEIPD
jgi:hypothetical protein